MPSLQEQMASAFSQPTAQELTRSLESDPELRASLIDALQAESKVKTKSEVSYRMGNEVNRCGNCSHFTKQTCNVVSGPIDPTMMCDYWESK